MGDKSYEKNSNNVDLANISGVSLSDNETLIIVKFVNDEVIVQEVKPYYINDDKLRVCISNYPIKNYTYEDLINIPELVGRKGPKISLKLNPNIKREDILEAKQKVKLLKKYK